MCVHGQEQLMGRGGTTVLASWERSLLLTSGGQFLKGMCTRAADLAATLNDSYSAQMCGRNGAIRRPAPQWHLARSSKCPYVLRKKKFHDVGLGGGITVT